MKNGQTERPWLIPKLMIALIGLYQKAISPLFPPSCRFSPTCSEYAAQAFTHHGLMKGLGLTLYRIVRCNPFNKGGFDPVPPKK
jgi:uncharacterized protein